MKRKNGDGLGYIGKDGLKNLHVLIAEKALGKVLPKGAEVHHVDEDKSNNEPTNLVICPSRAYHMLLHMRARALKACGNANFRKCRHCQKYDSLENLNITPSKQAYHKACAAKHVKEVRRVRGRLMPDGRRIFTRAKQANV